MKLTLVWELSPISSLGEVCTLCIVARAVEGALCIRFTLVWKWVAEHGPSREDLFVY